MTASQTRQERAYSAAMQEFLKLYTKSIPAPLDPWVVVHSLLNTGHLQLGPTSFELADKEDTNAS